MLMIFVKMIFKFSIVDSNDQVGHPVPLLQELKVRMKRPSADPL